ncbi:hypothetical protein EBS80_01640 [bacterium]|nr:hypothetical protein [bacterium]
MTIERFDAAVIGTAKRYGVPLARFSFFIVFFWFGVLKVLALSPAIPLVDHLLAVTLPFITPVAFNVFFGAFEMLIGLLFLVRGAERVVVPLFVLHMVTTFAPLVLLPDLTWTAPFVPTLTGQYILKNFVLLALAAALVAHMSPIDGKIS